MLRSLTIPLLLGTLALADVSAAAPVTWLFHGTVRDNQGGSPETFAALSSLGAGIGDGVLGTVTFESTTPGVETIPGIPIRYFFGAVDGVTVQFSDWSLTGPDGVNQDIAMASRPSQP